jgi:hypothetical protein
VALLGGLVGVGQADASASGRSWRALVGNGWPTQESGSNGIASLYLYWTGTGTLHVDLKNLVRNTTYSVTLIKGPLVTPGTSWSGRGGGCESLSDGPVVRLPAMRTTAAGTIVGSVSLSAGQMTAINKVPRKIGLTVGSGRFARCGGFQLQEPSVRATAPPTSPSPTVAPGPLQPTTCSAWPSEVAEVLAVLSTPDGLCLVRYPSVAEAPAFVQGLDGIYFPDPPTIHYVAGVASGETGVLAHEVCHAHQDRVTQDEGLTEFFEGWYRTAPGMDYLRTTGWRLQGGRWTAGSSATSKRPEAISNRASALEDNAVTCALWFDPARGPHFLRRWAPSRFAWAQRWLPLPSFIVSWQGDGAAN